MKEQLYKIGEAAKLLELETYVLRFWETEFPQLEPLRTPKGQRRYSAAHVALLHEVKHLLYIDGLTIDGARKVLERREQENTHIPPSPLSEKADTADKPSGHARGQSRFIAGFPPPPKPSDRQLLQYVRTELITLREALHVLDTPASTRNPDESPAPPPLGDTA